MQSDASNNINFVRCPSCNRKLEEYTVKDAITVCPNCGERIDLDWFGGLVRWWRDAFRQIAVLAGGLLLWVLGAAALVYVWSFIKGIF